VGQTIVVCRLPAREARQIAAALTFARELSPAAGVDTREMIARLYAPAVVLAGALFPPR
jgi:hypothetical protein